MNNKTEKGNPAASRKFIDWIRQDISNKNCSYMFNLM